MSAQTAAPSLQALSSSRCGRCSAPARVQRITPSRAGFEHWTLRCTKCGHIGQMQVVSSPSKPAPLDWFDSDLYPLK